MQPHKLLLSAALVAVVFLPQASAEDFYAEGFVSGLDTDGAGYLGSKLYFASVGARGGYSFNENFSLEGELQTGLNDEDIYLISGEADVSLKSTAAIFGRFSVPVSKRLNVYSRVGYASSEFETGTVFGDFSRTVVGGAYGLGATFNLTDKIYIRGDATRYDTNTIESDSIAIGAGLRF